MNEEELFTRLIAIEARLTNIQRAIQEGTRARSISNEVTAAAIRRLTELLEDWERGGKG